jgi:tRNA dimethylallyltransferase
MEVIVIGGPTASGKSFFALQLARHLKGVIINADSMQLYQGLPLLTACPSAEHYKEIPHYLYEHRPPDQPYSAAEWAQEAALLIQQQTKPVIIVGGTGFYLKTLIEGISPIPLVPEEIRQQVKQEWQEKGFKEFYKQLQQKDPELSAILKPTDQQRLCRAWEVLCYTGKSLWYWQNQPRQKLLPSCFKMKIMNPEKSWLYPIIDKRILQMIEQGIIEEIKNFLNFYPSPSTSLNNALGFKEFSAYLHHQTSLKEAIALTQQRTRQYAKRQMTWFRHQFKNTSFVSPLNLI